MKKLFVILSVCLAALTSVSAQTADNKKELVEKADSNGYIVFDGDKAPDFTITLTDGHQLKLSDLRGKLVMIQFTASWCGVCRKRCLSSSVTSGSVIKITLTSYS